MGSVAFSMGQAAHDRFGIQGCIGRGTGEADVAGGVPWQPRKADVGACGHAGVGWSGRGGRGGGGGGGGEGPGGSRLMRTRHAREVIEGQPLPTITRPAAGASMDHGRPGRSSRAPALTELWRRPTLSSPQRGRPVEGTELQGCRCSAGTEPIGTDAPAPVARPAPPRLQAADLTSTLELHHQLHQRRRATHHATLHSTPPRHDPLAMSQPPSTSPVGHSRNKSSVTRCTSNAQTDEAQPRTRLNVRGRRRPRHGRR